MDLEFVFILRSLGYVEVYGFVENIPEVYILYMNFHDKWESGRRVWHTCIRKVFKLQFDYKYAKCTLTFEKRSIFDSLCLGYSSN